MCTNYLTALLIPPELQINIFSSVTLADNVQKNFAQPKITK